jgi:hypothetical protein
MFKKGQPVRIPFCNKEGVVEHEVDCRNLVGVTVIKAKNIAIAPILKWYSPQQLLAVKEINQYSSNKHPHAELMLLYAQDAMETDKPWERWEFKERTYKVFETCYTNPAWFKEVSYRRKQKTIRIGNYDVPEPLRIAPEEGAKVYLVDLGISTSSKVACYSYSRQIVANEFFLQRGLLHLNKEAAELHAKALLSFTTMEINDD